MRGKGLLALTGAMLWLGMAARAQTPDSTQGPAAEAQRAYNGLKANILKAAQNTPDDVYTFQPAAGTRTFARVLSHLTEVQFHNCGVLNSTHMHDHPSNPVDAPNKAALVQALQASFAACDQAFAAATDANVTEMVPNGSSQRSRIGLLWGTVSHDNEQYTTLALYMRLKGLTPPSSEK